MKGSKHCSSIAGCNQRWQTDSLRLMEMTHYPAAAKPIRRAMRCTISSLISLRTLLNREGLPVKRAEARHGMFLSESAPTEYGFRGDS